jgi:hypothetical protein
MIVPYHTTITPQEERQHIWRHMDFAKYLSLLDKQALFFSKVSYLKDPYEGTHFHLLKEINPTGSEIFERFTPQLLQKKADIKAICPALFKGQEFCVNCWHLNEEESAALWRIYMSGNEGIAIKTSLQNLKKQIESSSLKIYLEKINYGFNRNCFSIDYNKKTVLITPVDTVITKRKSFEFEKEIRAIVSLENNPELEPEVESHQGFMLPINLAEIIQEIYINPEAPNWYVDLIKSINTKYGISCNVKKSTLSEQHPY